MKTRTALDRFRSPRVSSTAAINSAVLLPCAMASAFRAVQNSSSNDKLVRCPAMVMDRLIGPSVIVGSKRFALEAFALKCIQFSAL